MTKTFLAAIILFLFCSHSNAQVTDVGPNGKPNYRAVTGGSVRVKIDTISSLTTLINKLDSDWEFVETGKMYWIGYTDDMYSIAAHKDSAIQPLVEHFHSTKSEHAKYGVIFTLHLIGIESTIAGRFVEIFKNENARNALLKLATDKKYIGTIVALLGRDPWKTDLPALKELLRQDNNNIELVNALFQYTAIPYEENDIPFRQSIPISLDTINVLAQDSFNIFRLGTLIKVSYQEAEKERTKSKTFANRSAVTVKYKSNIIIHSGYAGKQTFWKIILNEQESQRINSYFKCDQQELDFHRCKSIDEWLDNFLEQSWEKSESGFLLDYWDHFQHYFEKNNLVICTVEQSAKRWLDYFSNKETK